MCSWCCKIISSQKLLGLSTVLPTIAYFFRTAATWGGQWRKYLEPNLCFQGRGKGEGVQAVAVNYWSLGSKPDCLQNLINFCTFRYIRDISYQTSANANLLSDCFEQLEQFCPKAKYPVLLLDSHPLSPLKKFPVRGNILPEEDGKIRPILFKSFWHVWHVITVRVRFKYVGFCFCQNKPFQMKLIGKFLG